MRAKEILGATAVLVGGYIYVWLIAVMAGKQHGAIETMWNGVGMFLTIGICLSGLVAISNARSKR
jgi:hypothetical protein